MNKKLIIIIILILSLSIYKRFRATLAVVIPYKCSASVADTPLLQWVVELACRLTATRYPERYAKFMFQHFLVNAAFSIRVQNYSFIST